ISIKTSAQLCSSDIVTQRSTSGRRRNMTTSLNMFVTACMVGSASLLFAADAASDATPVIDQAAPAAVASDPAAQNEPLQATIRTVKGIVQYRTGDDQPWQKVEEGLALDIGVEFRTGPRSAVTFHLPPDQLITLDRLGTLKLLD